MGHRLKKGKWPDGKVYYDFKLPDPDKEKEKHEAIVKLDLVAVIERCMAKWVSAVNSDGGNHIAFIRRTDQKVYKLIDLTQDSKNTSSGKNGYDGENPFIIKYSEPLHHVKSIPHELGHILGLVHENDRVVGFYGDADNKWTGNNPLMCPIKGSGANLVADFNRPNYKPVDGYDIWSIMHYPEIPNLYKWNCTYQQLAAYMKDNQDMMFQAPANAVAPEEWANDGKTSSSFNYPTVEEVINDLWSPSVGDIFTLRQWYPAPWSPLPSDKN
jgi:hypothetical protein